VEFPMNGTFLLAATWIYSNTHALLTISFSLDNITIQNDYCGIAFSRFGWTIRDQFDSHIRHLEKSGAKIKDHQELLNGLHRNFKIQSINQCYTCRAPTLKAPPRRSIVQREESLNVFN
jgi:hypothetical protein